MIKKTLFAILVTFFLLLAVGCGNNEPAPEEEEGIVIEVENNTEEIVISYAAFFGEGLLEWGEDLLGDEAIEPGEKYTFILPEGEYDLSLFNQDFFVIHSFFNLSGDALLEIGGEGKTPILIQNVSEHDILFFFAFPTGFIGFDDEGEDLGEDWAETWEEIWESESHREYQLLHERESIIAENGRRFFFIEPGVYDLLVINDEIEAYLETDIRVEADDRKVLTIE